MYWDIAADILFPPNFDEQKKYPAIISAHPIGSRKEQSSGNVYGTALGRCRLYRHRLRPQLPRRQWPESALH
jgi:fermentation-respiration switch protein FrsA (DUF1100 family)